MEISEIKEKAKDLKAEIENALGKFRDATGETPIIDISTCEEYTFCRVLISQTVGVQIKLING
jgi:hypothetical protein